MTTLTEALRGEERKAYAENIEFTEKCEEEKANPSLCSG
jgi:hypothetical protein